MTPRALLADPALPVALALVAALLLVASERRRRPLLGSLGLLLVLVPCALALARLDLAGWALAPLVAALVAAVLAREGQDPLPGECALKLVWVLGGAFALSAVGLALLALATGVTAPPEQWSVLQLGLSQRMVWSVALPLVMLAGVVLLGGAPFHFWVADLFQGAPAALAPLAVAALQGLGALARNTPGFSGADLANLTNEAALSATRRGADSIEARDFRAAYDKIVLGDLRESKLDTKEKHRVAVHEAGHAVVTHASTHAEPLHRVSIIPRGMALGVTQQTPAADRHIMTQPELEARLQVLMGGYAAERIVLGDVSTGAENDLKEATKLATKMVANYGMSKKLGAVYYDHDAEHPFLGHSVATDGGTSDATTFAIEAEARETLTAALAGATATIEQKRPQLDALVNALLERESLEQKDLMPILGPSNNTPEPDPTRASAPPPAA